MSEASWIACWDGYELRAISPQNLKVQMGITELENETFSFGVSSEPYTNSTYGDCYILLCRIKVGWYASCTLLISSGFWGNQHGSGDIIFIQCDSTSGTAYAGLNRTWLGGSHDRDFYYKIVDGYVYLYVHADGGNQHGSWKGKVLSSTTEVYAEGTCTSDMPSDVIKITCPQAYKSSFHYSNGTLSIYM